MTSTSEYMTAPQVRGHFGGVSDMTLWRWLRDESLGFPQPIYINGRRYFNRDKIENFERARAAASNLEAA